MALVRKQGGSNVTPTIVRRRSGGAWANVQSVMRRQSGTWVKVWSAYTPMTAAASPSSASGSYSTGTQGTYGVTSNTVTASATGGNASKVYKWTIVSGSGIVIGSPNSASTNFSSIITVNSGTATVINNGTARCTITDGTGSVYVDVPVSNRVTWTGPNN